MKRNEGISLIVLVITIIVMIILAGTIILTLNNNGIIDKANEAVKEYNLDEVEQVASLAWADAYLNGARTKQELEKAVKDALTANKITEINYDGYRLIVTENGVELEKIIPPGIYETGSNYGVLLYDWATWNRSYDEDWDEDSDDVVIHDQTKGDLVLPFDDSITTLNSAYYTCTMITSITIPVSVTTFEAQALSECGLLTDIYYAGSKAQWEAIDKYTVEDLNDPLACDNWNWMCGELAVHCTDGTIIIPACQ